MAVCNHATEVGSGTREIPPDTRKKPDSLQGGVAVRGVENISVRIVFARAAVEWIERPQNGVTRNKIEQIFHPGKNLSISLQPAGELKIDKRKPGRTGRPEIEWHHGKMHGTVDRTGQVGDKPQPVEGPADLESA